MEIERQDNPTGIEAEDDFRWAFPTINYSIDGNSILKRTSKLSTLIFNEEVWFD
jgi:hypothetical protein